MDLDPHLQNLTPVDLHDYQFAPEPGFDPEYPAGGYGHGHALSDEQHLPVHAQPHFVQDATGIYYSAAARQQQLHPRPSVPQRTTSTAQSQPPSQYSAVNVNIAPRVANGSLRSTGAHRNQFAVQTARSTQPSQAQYVSQYMPVSQIQQSPVQPSPSISRQPSTSIASNSPIPSARPLPPQPTSTSIPQLPSSTPTSTNTITTAKPASTDLSAFTHPSNFPLVPNPPDLNEWRVRFFNITSPIILTSEEYHTYFPHVDNIYSHRSTQKYKKKPFVSHYWDCRLKGRPTGTPLGKPKKEKRQADSSQADADRGDDDTNQDDGGELAGNEDGEKGGAAGGGGSGNKKRKRKVRERDLCDVKIKVTEYFGRDELEALGRSGDGGDDDGLPGNSGAVGGGGSVNVPFMREDGTVAGARDGMATNNSDSSTFGILEPLKRFPQDHPGHGGKRWYMVQRVNGTGKDGEAAEGQDLNHKHTLEESDRIKKNSVQRWLIAQEKEKKKQAQRSKNPSAATTSTEAATRSSPSASFHASGEAKQTAKAHTAPASSQLTLYANSFCPFAQRIWIALELKGIPYQYYEVLPSQTQDGKCTIPNLLEVCPEGIIPCIRHGNFGVWESNIMMEYLEDLAMGHSLLPLGNPQLRAHCRLWTEHINRRIVPSFYMLLLLPSPDHPEQVVDDASGTTPAERHSALISTVQTGITALVNASHATGPFFCGASISFVDVAFAPWIIRLSRVLSYYREFPRPEVGTRWASWVDAIEQNDAIRRTVSEERSYHNIYGGVAKDGVAIDSDPGHTKGIAEMAFARRILQQDGFGLGGDALARMSRPRLQQSSR